MAAMPTPADMGPDVNKIALYLVPSCILGALALGLCIARVYTRLRGTSKFFVDDYLIVAAEVRINFSFLLFDHCFFFVARHSMRMLIL
jgi:hypothetical protein